MPSPTAQQFFERKTSVPSSLTTAEWDRVRLQIRERSFFMACVTQAEILDVFRRATARVLSGEIGEGEARRMIREGLAKNGYAARPGEEGTIKDLSTLRRQDVVLRTNISMARNWAAYQKQWAARRAFPAKRMARLMQRREPRDWRARWMEAVRGLADASAEHMTALLDSPVWERLSRFGAPYAPYDFNSGMGDIAVRRAEAEAIFGKPLVDQWLGETRPAPGTRTSPELIPETQPAPSAPGPQPAPDQQSAPDQHSAPDQQSAPEVPSAPDPQPTPDTSPTPGPQPAPDPQPQPVPEVRPAPDNKPPAPEPQPAPGHPPEAITPALPGRPGPGLNATLEATPDISDPETRAELAEALDGLAVWEDGRLVYTDPNGTRPYPADKIAPVISAPNSAGIPRHQEDALRTWAGGGAPALPPGTDRAAYFAALVWRVVPMTTNETLILTRVFLTLEERAAALAKLPQGGTWQPVTEFPFLAFAKAGAAPETGTQPGYALTAQIVRHHTARDLTPAVEALAARADAHGHHVLMPRGAVFRIEAVAHPQREDAAVIITLIEEGGPPP
jgi:outer membrane biosynthesis protein TonB